MKGKMLAGVFKGNGKLSIEEVDIPQITSANEVIIRVDACSVCGTDVHILEVPPAGFDVKPGTILGHEIAGEVVEIGSGVRKIKIGDRVVVEPNDYCGICRYCLKGFTNHCENQTSVGVTKNGGFAEYVKVIEPVTHRIKDDLPVNTAVFAEPLACVVNGFRKIGATPGQNAFVIGAGPIALIYVQMLKAAGISPIIVSEPSPMRREFAKKCGADVVIDPTEQSTESVVKDITGIGADIVIDVVGSRMAEAVKAVRHAGKVLLFGFNTKAEPKVIQHEIVEKEIQVLGSWIARNTFPEAIEILEKGVLNLEMLITHILPIQKLEEGISVLKNGEGLEVIITPK